MSGINYEILIIKGSILFPWTVFLTFFDRFQLVE